MPSDERPGKRRETPFQAPLPPVSRGANLIVAKTGPSNAAAASGGGGAHLDYQSARGHSSGSADKRGGSSGGDGHTRRPHSAGNAGTVGNGEVYGTDQAFVHVRDGCLMEKK